MNKLKARHDFERLLQQKLDEGMADERRRRTVRPTSKHILKTLEQQLLALKKENEQRRSRRTHNG